MKRPRIAIEELGERVPENMQADLTTAADLVDQISPILAGKPPWVQSVTLAHLLSVWVCGFHATAKAGSDPRKQTRFRDRMLADHIRLVRSLVDAEIQANAGGSDKIQ